jgi:hypothetical protein
MLNFIKQGIAPGRIPGTRDWGISEGLAKVGINIPFANTSTSNLLGRSATQPTGAINQYFHNQVQRPTVLGDSIQDKTTVQNPLNTQPSLGSQAMPSYTQQLQTQTQSAVDEEAERRKEMLRQLNQLYGGTQSYVTGALKNLPGYQAEDMEGIGRSKDILAQGLQQGREFAGQQLEAQQSDSIRKLASNFRTAAQAANMLIGSAGAGDSSATGMASYALQKEANKTRADIQRTVMQEQSKIENTFNTEMNKVSMWYEDTQKQITQYYRGLENELKQMASKADDAKRNEIYNLMENLYAQAAQRTENLRAEARQYAASLEQWARERAAALSDYERSIEPELNPRELASLDSNVQMGGQKDSDYYQPSPLQTRRDEDEIWA